MKINKYAILGIIVIIIILFIISRFVFKTDIIYDKMCFANEDYNESMNEINESIINELVSPNYMISAWFYIDSWNSNVNYEKNILYIHSNTSYDNHLITRSNINSMLENSKQFNISDNLPDLHISLAEYNNDLNIDVKTSPETEEGSFNYVRYLVKNVPIQKWNCITLSFSSRLLDVYMDGKLINSYILKTPIYTTPQSNNKIYIGKTASENSDQINGRAGFEGYITRVRYQENSINPEEANKIYKSGINASHINSIYNKYGVKISFLEYNKEKTSFNI